MHLTSEKSTHHRPSWDDFFLQQLPALAARSTCDRGRSAAIFVRDNDQIAAGYVGSPPGMPHCDDVGHLWDDTGKHCIRTIHAEQNAMIRALRHGISLRDTTLYCTMLPCFTCAKLLVAVGTHRVVALHQYHDSKHTLDLFDDARIAYCVKSNTQLYEPQSVQTIASAPLTIAPTTLPTSHIPDTIKEAIRKGLACPDHNVLFESIEKCPGGARVCPHGETWVWQHGVLINLDELEPGELSNL